MTFLQYFDINPIVSRRFHWWRPYFGPSCPDENVQWTMHFATGYYQQYPYHSFYSQTTKALALDIFLFLYDFSLLNLKKISSEGHQFEVTMTNSAFFYLHCSVFIAHLYLIRIVILFTSITTSEHL